MKIAIESEANEEASPIRFATAIIEMCMNAKTYTIDEVDRNYHYLKEVNEHIDVFLKYFDYKGSESK